MTIKPVEKQRVSDEIVSQLRELILTGHYRPGDKLPPERELARNLGVNRASLREALKRLESQGLVRIRQGDGTRVEDYMRTGGLDLVAHLLPATGNPTLLKDVLEIRRLIGILLSRLAAERATEQDDAKLIEIADAAYENDPPTGRDLYERDFEFYLALGEASKNKVMPLLINTVRNAAATYAELLSGLTVSADRLKDHHRELAAAIAARDPDAAAQVVDTYLSEGTASMLTAIGAANES